MSPKAHYSIVGKPVCRTSEWLGQIAVTPAPGSGWFSMRFSSGGPELIRATALDIKCSFCLHWVGETPIP